MDPSDQRSSERTRPTARENWIAMLVLGISTAFLGIVSPQISPVIEIPPVLTILAIVVGATIIVVSAVRLSRQT